MCTGSESACRRPPKGHTEDFGLDNRMLYCTPNSPTDVAQDVGIFGVDIDIGEGGRSVTAAGMFNIGCFECGLPKKLWPSNQDDSEELTVTQ